MYGLFIPSENKLIVTKADSPEKIASIILFRAMKEDGITEYTKENRKLFLIGFKEHFDEIEYDGVSNNELEHITHHVADNLVYCNSPHIIDLDTKIQVSNDFTKSVYERIDVILSNSLI